MRLTSASPAFVILAFIASIHVQAAISLVERSPFVWPGFDETNATTTGAVPVTSIDFEFHAVYELSGRTKVLLKDNKNNKFHWLNVGEKSEGFDIKSYDKESNQLVFAYENQEKSLELKQLPKWVSTPLPSGAGRPTPATARSTSSGTITTPGSSTSSRRSVVSRPSTVSRITPIRSNRPPPPSNRGRAAVTGNPAFQPPTFTAPPAPAGDPEVKPPKTVPSTTPVAPPPRRP